jgi:hypothetical protein
MSPRKSLFIACLVASSFFTLSGYALAGQWIGVIASVIIGASWLLARKYPSSWMPLICLVGSLGLALGGCLSGAFPLLMILGSGISLAAWDLVLFNAAQDESAYVEQTRRHENRHIQSLIIAVGAGLLTASAGRFLQLQLPFVALVLFIGLFAFGMGRAWEYIQGDNHP